MESALSDGDRGAWGSHYYPAQADGPGIAFRGKCRTGFHYIATMKAWYV